MQYCINWGKVKGKAKNKFLALQRLFWLQEVSQQSWLSLFHSRVYRTFWRRFSSHAVWLQAWDIQSMIASKEMRWCIDSILTCINTEHQAYTKFSMALLYPNASSQRGPNAADAVEASYAAKVRTVPDVEMLSQPVSSTSKVRHTV